MLGARKNAVRSGLVTGLLALAACGDDGAGGQGAQPQAAAATPAATQAVAGESRVQMPECTPASNGNVAFRVGGAVLSVPGPVIENAIPSSLTGPLKREAILQEVQARVSRGEGCPATPLDARLLLVKDDLGHPLLMGNVGFIKTGQTSITDQFAQLTRQLRDNPEGRCRKQGDDLLACPGTETNEGREAQVLYLISTDNTARMSTGGPLFARCLLAEQGVRGCAMFDRLADGTTFDATLNPGDYTSDSLKSAQRAVMTKIASWRS